MHLHAVRRHRLRRLRPRGARRRELAAVGVQPRHRVPVHLLEGLRVGLAGGPAEDQKLQALGDFSQIEGLTPGRGRQRPSRGRLVAMNMRNNRLVWSVKWPTICYSGVTATAGNLVFTGTNERPSPGIQRADGPFDLAVAGAQGRCQRPRRHLQGERQAVRRRLCRRQRDRVALRRLEAELQLKVYAFALPS